ncbi:MAG: EAL domain-containing protein [Thermodesulfobacteriota bacterium]
MNSILIVDDDALVREMAGDILTAAGYKVFKAGDSEQALKILGKEDIRTVLLDVVLPSGSGIDMIPEINRINPDTAIIIMTAHASLDAAIEAIRKGAYDFIKKPLGEEELLHSMKKATERQALLLHNKILVEKLKGRLTRLELFRRVSKAISTTTALTEVLEKTMEVTKNVIGAEACSILLPDEETGDLSFTVALGKKGGDVKKLAIKPGQGIAGWVYKNKKPLLVRDIRKDKRFDRSFDTKTGFHTRSMVAAPLFVKDRILGVIQVINKIEGGHFEAEDRDILVTISGPIAISIDNARITEDLRRSEERFHKISASAQEAIIMIDDDARISYWNPASQKIFGYTEKEAVGREIRKFILPRMHRKAFKEGFKKFKKTGKGTVLGRTMVLSGIKKDGTEFPVEISVSAVKMGRGWNSIGIIRDITDRKRFEEKIQEMSYHDSLTGLPNRRLFVDRLNQVLARGKRKKLMAAFLFLDLDRFKVINDTLGHSMGDELLKAVAGRLQECLRTSDTFARIGGDEFTVLVQDINKVDDVRHVVEKIFAIFNKPFEVAGSELFVTASMGISIYPEDGRDVETLFKNADTAMYRAKSAGRNNYKLYTPEMNARAMEMLNLENDLRGAVDRGEFVLHYQPQVNIVSKEVVGFEALIRWNKDKKTLVYPMEFIPVCEDTGLIIPIGQWIFLSACTQAVKWRKKGLKPVRVSVNLSMRQFTQKDFVESIKKILDETGLDPEYLEFELTETMLMEDAEATIKTLHELKGLGIRLSIDDFGTGYSSLEYLKRMPIDMLKIAQSFTRDITDNPDDAAIASAVINIARSLNIDVIAEGVETKAQLELLKKLDCGKIQGFYVSKAVTAAEAEKYLKKDPPLKL